MVAAPYDQAAHGKASMWWLVLAYLFHTMGELCISPVGLSMVTKLAPLRLASLDDGRLVHDQLRGELACGHHRLVRGRAR
jgi:hypothetical protein